MNLFRVLLSTGLGLLLLTSNVGLALEHGSDPFGRYDILQGSRGESACTLKNVIGRKCTTSSTRRDFLLSTNNRNNDTPPVPSRCTCNAIYFNIWSACYYSTGNKTLPNFAQWTQNCTTSSINVDSSTQFSEGQGNLGIDVPSWAKMRVPGNSTFDIQRAVTRAFSTSVPVRWTTLQKVLPVVAVFGTLLISGIVLLAYQRYQRNPSRGNNNLMEWPKGMKRLHLHTSHKVVTTIDRDEAWEIDGPIKKQASAFHDFDDDDDMGVHHHQELDKNSKTVPSNLKSTTTATTGEKEKAAPVTGGIQSFRIPTRSRLPWKRRPPYIRLVPATSRFRVDDAKSIFTCSGEAVGKNEINVVQELTEDVPLGNEETTSLITASERDSQEEVILISNGNRSFTLESRSENTVSVNSHIKIISPSVSSTSPHSAMYPYPVSAKPRLYIPIPPPPPSHVAPAPPVMLPPTTTTERYPPSDDSNRSLSLGYFQYPFLSPIKEATSPAQSSSSSHVTKNHLRRSLAIRRSGSSSNPGSISVSSLHRDISPAGSSNTLGLPPSTSQFNLRRTASPSPDLISRVVVGSEDDDFYMPVENTTSTNGHYYPGGDSDASIASIYYNSSSSSPGPVRSVQRQLHSTDPAAAFYAGPVRGRYYSVKTNSGNR